MVGSWEKTSALFPSRAYGVPQGKKSFTNKINYSMKQILKTLAKEPRGKTKKWIKHLPNTNKGIRKGLNLRMSSFQVVNLPFKWIDLASL
jgi:hypothetical protein